MLKRHLLRSKLRIRDVSAEYDVWAMWNPYQLTYGLETERRRWECHGTGVIEPAFDQETEAQWGSGPWGSQPGPLIDRRGVGLGLRVLAQKGTKPRQLSPAFDEGTAEDYRVHRYLNGVPEGNDDLQPTHAFPANSSLDIMGALCFKKGCHLGQEHLSRVRHVNELRRRLYPVIIHRSNESADDAWRTSKPNFPPNLEISSRYIQEPADGQPASRVKNALVSNARGVGLAMLRTEDVDAWEAGESVLEFDFDAGSGVGMDKWHVSPSKPVWWPNPVREADSDQAKERKAGAVESVGVGSVEELLALYNLEKS
ncbi:ccr4 associated factor [Steccherinum ochraceum]|uniref:Ccr4 associated factor n=1 Tax=Steccherinum ochraceum TaxID=92696 RepID=A0A4R0R6G7_9APHY|nr:ccr4 associated factor [Steccherinum ochraceum]